MPIAPLASDPNQRTGFTQFNPMAGAGFGSGTGMMDMIMQMIGGSLIGSSGMFPGGMNHQNMYDRMQHYRLQQMHDQLLKDASRRDAETYYQNLMGLARLSGTSIGESQIRNAQSLASNMANFGPMAVQFLPPMILDALGGSRGLNVVMSEYMFRGGQFRMDPATGQMGMDPAGLKRLVDDTYSGMFSGDNWKRHTLSAGQAGQLFEELQRTGMMPSGRIGMADLLGVTDPQLLGRHQNKILDALYRVAPGTNLGMGPGFDPRQAGQDVDPAQLRGVIDRLPASQASALRDSPEVSGIIKAFDSRRVMRSLEDYSGVLKAIKEIFGDAGHPNAPMPQLINALNQLTGGAMTQMSPGEVERALRVTSNLATNTGIGLQGAMMLSEVATQQAMAMGLPPIFAADALQGSLAFRGAFQQQNLGGHPAWGMSGIQQQTVADQQLRLAAAGSVAANQAGTALRLNALGGEGQPAFRAGSTAAAYIAALNTGSATFTDPATGRQRSINLEQAEFSQMLQQGSTASLDQATIFRFLQQRDTNFEFVKKSGVTHAVRLAQRDEVFELLQQDLSYNAGERISGLGLGTTGQQAGALGDLTAGAAVNALKNMNPAQRADRGDRNQIMMQAVTDQLQLAAQGKVPGMDAKAAQGLLQRLENDPGLRRTFAEELYGGLETFAKDPTTGFGSRSAQDFLLQFSAEALEGAEQARAKAEGQAIVQEAMAPLGRSGGLRRAMQALQNVDKDSTLTSTFIDAMGGIKGADIAKALGPAKLKELQTKYKALTDAAEAYESASPADRPKLKSRLMRQQTEFRKLAMETSAIASEAGYFGDNLVDKDSLGRLGVLSEFTDTAIGDKGMSTEKFRNVAEAEAQGYDDFIATMFEDKGAMLRLGAEGVNRLDKMQAVRAALEWNAAAYAEGDMGKLLRGELSGYTGGDKDKFMKDIRGYRNILNTHRKWFEENIEGGKGDYSFLSDKQKTGLQDILKRSLASGKAPSSISDLGSLLDPKLDLAALVKSGAIEQDDVATITGARKRAEWLQEIIKERKDDYKKTPDQILKEAYAAHKGLADTKGITDKELAGFYGDDIGTLKTQLGAASRAEIGAFSAIIRDKDEAEFFAKRDSGKFDEEHGFIAGKKALGVLHQIQGGEEDEDEREHTFNFKFARLDIHKDGGGEMKDAKGVPPVKTSR